MGYSGVYQLSEDDGLLTLWWKSGKSLEDFPCLLDSTLSNGVGVECRKVIWGRIGHYSGYILEGACMWTLEDRRRIQVVAQVEYAEEVIGVPFGKAK